jgi:putative transposase
MIATSRIQRRYDHRLQAMVKSAGSIEIALEHGIPRSTARGWLRGHDSPSVVSIDVVDQDTASLQLEALALRRKVKRLTALLRLMFVVFKFSQFSFAKTRVQDAKDKKRILAAIDRCREHLPLQTVTRLIGLSRSRYHEWKQENPCALDDRSSCPKKSVHQITPTEIGAIRDMVTSDEYRHVPTAILAQLAERLGKVFVSASTWYRLIRIYKWRRPRLRLYPAKLKVGIRAAKPNEIWHVDTTQIKLLDGSRVYIHAIIDNFSRRVLTWNVTDTFNPAVTASLLRKALEGSTTSVPTLMVDGGIENYNTSVDEIVDEGLLKRVLAQSEINFSNSMIESFWKAMKHQWLYLNTLGSVKDVQNLVSFYISEHNTKLPHSAFKGQTPDEMYFGTGADIPDQLKTSRLAARQKRLESNRAQ